MRFFFLVGLTALALFSAGCSKRESAVEAARKTHTLHLGNHAEPRDLDPNVIIAYTDYNILMALFEGLTVIDEATSQPIPGTADHWEISTDGLVYTFHLRPTARWSNGDPVTADEFAFSMERILSPELASEYSYMLFAIKGAEDYTNGKLKEFSQVGVKVIDPATLQLTLARPTPYLLAIAAHQSWFPLHKATILKFGAAHQKGTRWTRPENFVGNGAFTLESWSPDERIITKRNPHYWDNEHNTLERVIFYPIASEAVEESNFRTGQLHITYDILPDRIDTYRREAPQQIRIDPFLETFFLRFNVTKPPLNDKRVRQALARAIDREAIATSVMRGSRLPAYFLTPPNTAGYTATAKIPSDFEAARRLLADAGYPGGKGFPTIEIQMNSEPINMMILEAVQQMWRKELGIDAALVQLEFRVYLDYQHSLNYSVSRSRWVGDYNDPSTFTDLFTSGSGNNDTGWKNPAYDELVDQAAHALDTAKRYALLQKAEALLLDEAPIAPIYFGTRTYLIHPTVKGWVPSLLGIHRYQTVRLE